MIQLAHHLQLNDYSTISSVLYEYCKLYERGAEYDGLADAAFQVLLAPIDQDDNNYDEKYDALKKFNNHLGSWIQSDHSDGYNRNLEEAQVTVVQNTSVLIRRIVDMRGFDDSNLSYKEIDKALNASYDFQDFFEFLSRKGTVHYVKPGHSSDEGSQNRRLFS